MKEEAVKKSKVKNISSKVQDKIELTDEELLDQILAKKKNKNNVSKSNSNVNSTNKKSTRNNTSKVKKVPDNSINNDDLYEQIKAKKQKKVKTTKDSNAQKKEIVSSNEISEEKVLNLENTNSDESKSDLEEKKVNDDLIITREINFDKDVLDLKNKKTLAELREAIEEFDRLESYPKKSVNKITEERNKENLNNHSKYKKRSDRYLSEEEQGILLSSKKNNFRKKFDSLKYDNNDKQKAILILLSMILFVILIGVLGFYYGSKETDNNSIVDKRFDEQKFNSKKLEEEKKQKDFSECLSKSYSEQELNEQINKKVLELNEYIKANYDASIFYEDLSLGFSYSYNSSVVYYAASTIKSLDALYIYTKASLGEINLDDTMIYSSKYKWGSSKEMKKYQYGQKVTLRNLVKYAVTVSDNSAHQMLVDYIGKKNLKEFGKSLGATNTLVGADNFGSIDVKDGIIYMKAINDFIINNGELGDELKNYFVVAEQNDLSLPDLGIEAAHKYGQYGYYYHDIGIVYDEHPYVVAILTNEGAKNYEAKVKDINKHIYDLHKEFYLNRENVCQIEIYGN